MERLLSLRVALLGPKKPSEVQSQTVDQFWGAAAEVALPIRRRRLYRDVLQEEQDYLTDFLSRIFGG